MTIETHFIEEYNNNLQLLSQQMKSRFRGTMMEKPHVGKGAAIVDQFGALPDAVERTQRAQPIVQNETPRDRRWVSPRDFDTGEIIDEADRLRLAVQPDSAIMRSHLAVMNRKLDDLIIAAFFADAKTGVDGTTTTAFPTAPTQTVANTVGAAAATGMNVKKLLAARRIIMANEVDLDDPMNTLYCAISSQEEDALLDQVKVVSTDYQNQAVLSGDGKALRSWFGINFVITERLTTVSTDRLCPFWAKSGMHIGIWKDISGDIRRLPTYQRNPVYIEQSMTANATRTEESKVVKILCSTS